MTDRDELEREQVAVRELEASLASPALTEALERQRRELEAVVAEQHQRLEAARAQHHALSERLSFTRPPESSWWFIASMPLAVVGGLVGAGVAALLPRDFGWSGLWWGFVLLPFIVNVVRIFGAVVKLTPRR